MNTNTYKKPFRTDHLPLLSILFFMYFFCLFLHIFVVIWIFLNEKRGTGESYVFVIIDVSERNLYIVVQRYFRSLRRKGAPELDFVLPILKRDLTSLSTVKR